MKTIRQIADEIGVSKQAVHQKRKSKELSTALQSFTSTVDGVVYIDVDGEMLIKSAFSVVDRKHVDGSFTSTIDGSVTPVDGQKELYNILKTELEAKNEQIEKLQLELASERQHSREQSDKLALLAEQAQMLHAGTMQRQLTDGGGDQPEPDFPRNIIARLFKKKRSNEKK